MSTCVDCESSAWHHCPVTREARREAERRYNIVRSYFDAYPRKRVLRWGVTLEEAQAHCRDPETSSSTATNSVAKRRTKRLGPWFDGYEEAR